MKPIILATLLALTACGDSDKPTPPPDVQNAAMVGTASTRLPTLAEVFVTDDEFWFCGFGNESGTYWQTVATFNADGTGYSEWNYSPLGQPVTDTYTFAWSGEQALTIVGNDDVLTIFNFVYQTDPLLAPDHAVYHFAAENSQGTVTVCTKYHGEWG